MLTHHDEARLRGLSCGMRIALMRVETLGQAPERTASVPAGSCHPGRDAAAQEGSGTIETPIARLIVSQVRDVKPAQRSPRRRTLWRATPVRRRDFSRQPNHPG